LLQANLGIPKFPTIDAKDDITLYLLASAIMCLVIIVIIKVKQLYLLIGLKEKL
jgi:hypothetical protein